jgi:TolB-like protein/DNA-binding winged helix-turn-helix (wHTH) protein/Flp pilus assembly protein TadD
MERSHRSPRNLRFGVFEVDLAAGELRKQGLRLKLAEQPLQILVMLLERPGEIVSRDLLRERLWHGGTFVDFDHGLNNAVMRLREVLGDSSERPKFIETIPRRGYRFVASVDPPNVASGDLRQAPSSSALIAKPAHMPPSSANAAWYLPGESQKHESNRTIALSRIAALVIGVLAVSALMSFITVHYVRGVNASKGKANHSSSLVVLPLENLSGERGQDYFADGITDELITNLARIHSLRVVSRSTAMAYKGTHKPLPQIAAELNVDAVVEGTVMRVGNRVRITAELVQVSTDNHLWADTYESPIGDILGLQNTVSAAIADEIRINLTEEDRERLGRKPAIGAEAYEDYLKGRYYWNKRTNENFVKAIGYFEDATRRDPQYALAYAGIADCYSIIGSTLYGNVPASEAAPKAKAAAIRALAIDPTLAEAQTSLATAKFNYDWDWTGAAEGFKTAIRLDPSYATAYQRYSLYLIALGRFDDSFQMIKKARELEPLSTSINSSLGWRLYLAREYDRSIAQLRETLDMDPSYEWARLILGQAYEQKGQYGLAIAELQRAVELSHSKPVMVSALAHAYAASGNLAEAAKLLTQLKSMSKKQYVSPFYVAMVYVGMGKKDSAMRWLEKAYEDGSNGLVFLKVEPELDSLRMDPRFKSLQQKLHFLN